MANKGSIIISIEGIDEVKDYLKDKNSAVYRAAEEAIKQGLARVSGEVTQSIAGHRAETMSFDTGNLARSVSWQQNGLEGEVFTEVEYAPYLEYGTTKIRSRNHFRNTAARERPTVQRYVENEVKKATK